MDTGKRTTISGLPTYKCYKGGCYAKKTCAAMLIRKVRIKASACASTDINVLWQDAQVDKSLQPVLLNHKQSENSRPAADFIFGNAHWLSAGEKNH